MEKSEKNYLTDLSLFGVPYPSLTPGFQQLINKKVRRELSCYTKKTALLQAALIQNPLGETLLSPKRKKLSARTGIDSVLDKLNHLRQGKTSVFKNFADYEDAGLLFLLTYKVLYTYRNKCPPHIFDPKIISFAMKVLQRYTHTQLHTALEDCFFSILQPKLFNNYQTLLKITKKKYLDRQKEVVSDFRKILKSRKIEATIESRIKSIYSIHNKIVKKDLIFSQILDTIGIRIIVTSEEDCYKAMVMILKNNAVISSRIKDYIAIPKENGYQSLHLTIIYEDIPVEIQIRTWAMHIQSQYGKASHLKYKNEKSKIEPGENQNFNFDNCASSSIEKGN